MFSNTVFQNYYHFKNHNIDLRFYRTPLKDSPPLDVFYLFPIGGVVEVVEGAVVASEQLLVVAAA